MSQLRPGSQMERQAAQQRGVQLWDECALICNGHPHPCTYWRPRNDLFAPWVYAHGSWAVCWSKGTLSLLQSHQPRWGGDFITRPRCGLGLHCTACAHSVGEDKALLGTKLPAVPWSWANDSTSMTPYYSHFLLYWVVGRFKWETFCERLCKW